METWGKLLAKAQRALRGTLGAVDEQDLGPLMDAVADRIGGYPESSKPKTDGMREALEAISADYAKGARGGPEQGLPAGERPVPVPIPSGGGGRTCSSARRRTVRASGAGNCCGSPWRNLPESEVVLEPHGLPEQAHRREAKHCPRWE